MKAALFIMCILVAGWANAGEWKRLPEARISEKTLGGTVLFLRMKYTLVISGDQQEAMTKELGEGQRKEIFKRMVMDAKPDQLRKEFAGTKRPVTIATIARYEAAISEKVPVPVN